MLYVCSVKIQSHHLAKPGLPADDHLALSWFHVSPVPLDLVPLFGVAVIQVLQVGMGLPYQTMSK